jgi:flagellar basal-body rod protein FlgF
MDRALYVALSGATQTLRAQAANNHNLANASTTGFKAELVVAEAQQIAGTGFESRVNARSLDAGIDSRAGTILSTGRELDVALGAGDWLAVQAADGREAYTRAGELQVDAEGLLRTRGGQEVLGEGGAIQVPPHSQLSIGSDGSISVIPLGQTSGTAVTVGRLKIVAAEPTQLTRAGDNLYFAREGSPPLESSSGAKVVAGALESSNVNIAESMVTMIELARNFELQTRAMKSADENAQQAASLLRMK